MSKSAISIWYKASPTFWQVVSFCSNLVPPTAASVCSLSPLNLPLTGIWTGEREKDRRVQISIWPSTWRERNLFLFVYKSRQKNGKGWLLRTMCAVIICHHRPPASLKNSKIVPPALFDSKTSTAATDNAAPQNFLPQIWNLGISQAFLVVSQVFCCLHSQKWSTPLKNIIPP